MTMHELEYRRLLRHTLITAALCIIAVLICYFWIDRPVAFFVYRHHINRFQVFRWLTYPPPEVQNWAALALAILMVRRAWGPFLRWQKVLLVACISLIVAVAIGRRRGPMTIHRSSALARTVSIRFSVAMTSAVFHRGTPVESWDLPPSG